MAAITQAQAASLGLGADIVRQLDLLERVKELARLLFDVIKAWGLEYLEELVEDAPELVLTLLAAMGDKAKRAAGDVLEDAGDAFERATGTDWDGDGKIGGD